MMIKGKNDTYEWRNYSYFDVLGWREITENKTNTKENKTMKKSRENRMEALKAANIETGKYFSVTLPEGLKPGSTINVTISEDGSPVIVSPEKKRNSERWKDLCRSKRLSEASSSVRRTAGRDTTYQVYRRL